jgi:hypothetical protein
MGPQGPVGATGATGPAGADGLGYVIQAGYAANLSPADARTYYVGCFPSLAPTTTADRTRCYIPKSGRIKSVYGTFWNSGTLSSAQASTIAVRINNTTSINVSTSVANNAVTTTFNDSNLSIAVSAGDYFEVTWTTPTWTTNPTNTRMSVMVYVAPDID